MTYLKYEYNKHFTPAHRRSKLEIYVEVLSIIHKGTKKPTRIMYAANISWKPLQNILKSMLSQGHISEVASQNSNFENAGPSRKRRDKRTKTYYELTQKGENVIKYFHSAKDLLELEEFTFLKTKA